MFIKSKDVSLAMMVPIIKFVIPKMFNPTREKDVPLSL